ncbi:hypothetical protein F5Y10DRAFT_241805 [Nemania abortiva]|nr:hypothetical protein F5Y10DRAFT_241805 [Nemania abortiva]
MVDKGLVVTLVLDCCFSASVYRNIDSENARYLSYNWPDSRQASDLENSLASLAARSTKRDASMRDNWLLNPDQYTILAACGPHETAKERLETSQWSGALSSRLVKALSSSSNGLRRSHGDIYRHLRTSFRESGVAQNPVLYGNQNQGFFGLVDPDHQLRAIGIAKHEGKVRLLAGKAHGFRDGDKFDILSQSTSNLGSKERLIAKITRTGPLTSELELPNSLDSLAGWIAKPLDGSYPQDFRIQLAPNLPHKDEWLTVLKERSLEAHINVEQAFDLKVVLGSSGEYEILNEHSQKVINLPTLPQSQTNAKRICNIIEHLAQFTMVKNLSNKLATNNFRNSFEVRMSADKKEPYSPGEQIEIQHESIVRLQITRKKEDTGLYIFVYDLGPFWKVERMHGATYVDMPPRKKLLANGGYARDIEMCEWKIKMMVPDVLREHGSCEDIIKIIVTSKPTTFDLLELPDIEKLSSASTKLRITHFEDVLEDWAAFNFPIRTSC